MCSTCGCRKAEEQNMSKDIFSNMRDAKKRAKELGTNKIHSHKINGDKIYMPFKTHKEYTQKMSAEGSDNRAFSLFLYAAGGIFYGYYSQDIIKFIKEKMGWLYPPYVQQHLSCNSN